MQNLSFSAFPFPPSENMMYPTIFNKYTRKLTRIPSRELKEFQIRVRGWAIQNALIINPGRKFLTDNLTSTSLIRINATIYLEKSWLIGLKNQRKAFDAHNRIKALFDGIASVFQIDDRYFYCGEVKPVIAPADSISFSLKLENLENSSLQSASL